MWLDDGPVPILYNSFIDFIGFFTCFCLIEKFDRKINNFFADFKLINEAHFDNFYYFCRIISVPLKYLYEISTLYELT